MIDWKKLFGKRMMTRALAALILALVLLVSACDGQQSGVVDTTAADTVGSNSTTESNVESTVGSIHE